MSRMKRILLSAGVALAAVVLLAATVYAATWLFLKVKDNYFETGDVEVSIETIPNSNYIVDLFYNDGIIIEPGATICGDFAVQNNSNDPEGIWYRVYVKFGENPGKLANVLEATLKDASGNEVVSGSLSSWKNPLHMSPVALGDQSTCKYTLELHYPEEAGNDTQQQTLAGFELVVVAVQRKNNPTGLFN